MTVKDLWCSAVVQSCSFRAARLLPVSLAVLISAYSLGCSGAAPTGPKRYPISGTVNREGIPIDSGTIKFVPTGGGPAASGLIANGKYEFSGQDGVPAGKFKVTISADPNYDKSFKGRKNDAPILPDDRFKKSPPVGGWKEDAEVTGEANETHDFDVN